jgi:hypothetical protein
LDFFLSHKVLNLFEKMSEKTEKKKNRACSADDLREAIEEVKNGTVTAWKAAKKYKIPYQSLKNKIDGKYDGGKHGATTKLTAADEDQLVDWIKRRARIGHPIDKAEFFEAVTQIAEKRGGKKFTNNGECS